MPEAGTHPRFRLRGRSRPAPSSLSVPALLAPKIGPWIHCKSTCRTAGRPAFSHLSRCDRKPPHTSKDWLAMDHMGHATGYRSHSIVLRVELLVGCHILQCGHTPRLGLLAAWNPGFLLSGASFQWRRCLKRLRRDGAHLAAPSRGPLRCHDGLSGHRLGSCGVCSSERASQACW
jgi:hypothetical protein